MNRRANKTKAKRGRHLAGLLCLAFGLLESPVQAQTPSSSRPPRAATAPISQEADVADLVIRSNAAQPSPEIFAAAPLLPPFTKAILSASEQLIERAKSLLGIAYKYGGNRPETGFDCSGLVRFVFREALGINLATRAEEMGRSGERLADVDLSPGDLVFFNTLNRPFSHVGIYLGNRQFLHSPSSGGVVRIESMAIPYWTKRYQGARRLVLQEAQPSTLRGVIPDVPHGLDVLVGPTVNLNAPELMLGTTEAPSPVAAPSTPVATTRAGVGKGAEAGRGQESRYQEQKPQEQKTQEQKIQEQKIQESKVQELKSPDQLDLFIKKLKEKP
jgi:cell wall-associated NlpC family hydrolase